MSPWVLPPVARSVPLTTSHDTSTQDTREGISKKAPASRYPLCGLRPRSPLPRSTRHPTKTMQ
jgi:hypothetical protein